MKIFIRHTVVGFSGREVLDLSQQKNKINDIKHEHTCGKLMQKSVGFSSLCGFNRGLDQKVRKRSL